jgi:hypothetical protein
LFHLKGLNVIIWPEIMKFTIFSDNMIHNMGSQVPMLSNFSWS